MKVGLIICTYNRPEYLRQCLASIEAADIPAEVYLVPVIVDDASTDMQTRELVLKSNYNIIRKAENKSIKDSLIQGCDWIIDKVDLIINLDGDAIVRKDFIAVLLELKKTFPDSIITGFNCLTKNRDGSERHKVLTKGIGFNTKKSVGGINMVFDKRQYTEWIRPSLVECLQTQGNWDHKSCLRSEAAGFPIVCAVPSVVQHIGIDSAMGHSKSEPPDQADDFEMTGDMPGFEGIVPMKRRLAKLQLPNITLIGADCVDVDRLIRAADKCCENIEFGAVKILSSFPSKDKRVVPCRHLATKSDYSEFIMKDLYEYVDTDYLLIFQYDGYVLNHKAWRDEWLKYDYIGAPWNWYDDGMQVGNGGLSLRTKKLMQIVAEDNAIVPVNEDGVTRHKEEDHCICRLYRRYLEKNYDIKFAPIEEARLFSIEGWRSPNRTWTNEFGFHGGNLTNVKP